MQGIKGVEAILGCYAFDLPACAVINEDHDGGKYGSGSTIIHHQRKCEKNLEESPVLESQSTAGISELTIPHIFAEIKKNNIKYPKIVLAQAILETGWFKSSVCRNKNNLFGLTHPRTKTYYEFGLWTESVDAYY